MDKIFNGAKALEYAKAISYPRLVGTAGEKKARAFLQAGLEQMGYAVESRPFTFWPALPLTIVKSVVAVCLASLGILFILEPSWPRLAGYGGLAVGALAMWTAWMYSVFSAHPEIDYSMRMPLISALAPGLSRPWESANILARKKDAKAGSRTRVVFLAHTDTKSQNISIVMRIISVSLMYLGLFGIVIRFALDIFFPLLPLTDHWQAVAAILYLMTLAGGIGVISLRVENESPGSTDNAGSVGVLMHLAEVLASHPIADGIDVRFVLTGAEELGLAGGYAYAHSEAASLWADALHINLDGVGGGGKLMASMETGLLTHYRKRYAKLMDLVTKAAKAAGMELKTLPIVVGGAADHFPLVQNGLAAVTLGQYSSKSWAVHTPADGPDLLNAESMESIGRILLEALKIAGQKADAGH